MVDVEKKLINAIQPKKFDGVAFKSDPNSIIIPNNSGVSTNYKGAFMHPLYLWGSSNARPHSISATSGTLIIKYELTGAEVKINANGLGVGGTPGSGTALVLTSTSQALLLTRLTTAQKNAITGIAGMIAYDSDLGKLCVYTGAAWETVTSV